MSKQNPAVQQQNTHNAKNTNIKLEDPPTQSVDWNSERQIISSLAKLQELETKIHELRSLLPERLLGPINPIVNPRRRSPSNPIARNPQEFRARLKKSATEGVAEIDNFKNLWQSPDMQATWAYMNQKMTESKGVFPQPSGMWDRDYEGLLKEFDEKDGKTKKEKKQQKVESSQNAKDEDIQPTISSNEGVAAASVVESFQKKEIPGFYISIGRDASITVSLALVGIALDLQKVITNAANSNTSSSDNATSPSSTSANTRSLPEWRVSPAQQLPGNRPASRLETAIVQQLNNRPRKWDLRYLLEMIQAYSNIKQTPCKKCNNMTDSQAQLPVVRRPVGLTSADTATATKNGGGLGHDGENTAVTTWEAYHTGCV